MRVVYSNRSPAPNEAELGAQRLERDALLAAADHVVLVLPYSKDTHHLIGARELGLMKPTATLVNIARGCIVDDGGVPTAVYTANPDNAWNAAAERATGVSRHAVVGQRLDTAVFTLPAGLPLAALVPAAVAAFLAFCGFESAGSLGEEARRPRRAVPRAMLLTVML